ncbi:MAG: fumarate hydratase C-terminal domain-containing protein [Clostridia bacterium]|nr:fumarate hydratase C-terminal domain-containing protein [Clostridia bacterium]MBQ8339773.1 fumarate hydratase C-terminal domain-containing protein [Clostridia bacterium]
MKTYHLKTPLSQEDVEKLEIGDVVYLTGEAFTCRSRLHRWVLDENHPLPDAGKQRDLLIHVGPIVLPEPDGKWRLISFMPTSSIRFEKWGARAVDEWGLRMIVGKTTMGEETMAMMREKKCVHVSPQCVSPNSWIQHIEIEKVDLFRELGTIEATWSLKIDELGPFVVDIDCRGNNLYKNHEAEVDANREKALADLGIDADFEYTKLY